MKIKWLGHASFLITSATGTRIITDPYKTGGSINYGEIKETADVVTVSHEHGDHNNPAAVSGQPAVVRESADIKGINFRGIKTFHDDAGGTRRGGNVVFCFTVDGISICHLGDLGHPLDNRQIEEIGKVDILLIPVGGHYTIDAAAATVICQQLQPAVIIPMHFKNEKNTYPINGVDVFIKGQNNVSQPATSEADFQAGQLPAELSILVLKPAL